MTQRKYPPPSKRAPSLKIDELIMFAYAMGNLLARAAVDAWKPNFPVVRMDAEEYDERVARGWTQ